MPSPGNAPRCQTIEFLIQEKSCFLPIFHIHIVVNSILHNMRYGLSVFRIKKRRVKEPLILRESFQFAYLHIISFIYTADRKPMLPEHFNQAVKDDIFVLFYSQRQDLHRQNISKSVDGKPRKLIRLTKDDSHIIIIFRPHNLETVIQRIGNSAFPEGIVKSVIGICGYNTNRDLGVFIIKATAYELSLSRQYPDNLTWFNPLVLPLNFRPVNPGMSPFGCQLCPLTDCYRF